MKNFVGSKKKRGKFYPTIDFDSICSLSVVAEHPLEISSKTLHFVLILSFKQFCKINV